MIYKIVGLGLLLLPVSVFAQVDFKNMSLTDPSLNILYVGVDNNIQIAGLKDTSLLLISSRGIA